MAVPLTSILKTTPAADLAASVEVRDENPEKGGQGVQGENQGEKEPVQKSCKGQKTAKSKKWIRAKKAEAFRARNFNSQSGAFLTIDIKRAITKLKQTFIETPILNHLDLERYIRIQTDTSGYIIDEIFSQLTLDNLCQ